MADNQPRIDGIVEIKVGAPPERFETLAADHGKWRSVSTHLFAAAQKLWPFIELGFWKAYEQPLDREALEGLRLRGPFCLLIGLAFENYAKAIIVLQRSINGLPVTESDVLKLAGSHDLDRIVRLAGVSLSEVEESMLANLSRFVQWQGRYPIPKRAKDLGADSITSTKDMETFQRFFDRLAGKYDELAEQLPNATDRTP